MNGNYVFEYVCVVFVKSFVKVQMEVDSDFQCLICLELFFYFIILFCLYVLCRFLCVEYLFDFNFIWCLVCWDNCYVSGGIGSLLRVIVLENIIECYKVDRILWENIND